MSGPKSRLRSRFQARWRTAPIVLAALVALGAESRWARAQNRPAQKFEPDSSGQADKLLRNAAALARDRQWSEAINIYQRVIDQFGDKVALVPRDQVGAEAPDDFTLYVDERRFCHGAIAQLPPEAREVYRNRIDGLAARWFADGARLRDTGALRRVVDQAFCSSWGDDALELLGDLAFQDGRFAEALGMYLRLVADSAGSPDVLVHPDPSVDLARVAAKKVLCRAGAGENLADKSQLELYARLYPAAAGALAGRKGPYHEILADALASDHLAPSSQADSRWPTFAGSLTRTRVVPGPIDVGSTQWRIELEKVGSNRQTAFGPRGVGGPAVSSPERLLVFHPIVLGDQVIVCDGSRVFAYNLNDRPADSEVTAPRPVDHAWKYDPETGSQGPQARMQQMVIPRFTLTTVGHKIYARMGAMNPSFMAGMGGGGRSSSSIIALDWNTQGKLLWERKSTSIALPNQPADRNGNNRTVSFEGTPVADARNVYVALTDRREQTATYIACLDADTSAPRWVRYLGTASPDVDVFFGMPIQFGVSAPGDFNHRLLTLDGPTIYYQTNLGALVALEAETGRVLWVATYPRQEPNNHAGGGSERDLNPAVVHEGRVIVAPSDADAIFAFDAASGRLLWKSDPISDDVKLTHLLGVAKNRLVATGNRVLLFDVKTGKLVHAWPDSAKSLEGYGRGLLAGDFIYWPTNNEIQILDQRTALRAEPPIKLFETYHTKGGNLVAGDGYLIVAQQDGMVVFCQNSRLIERYKGEIARAPDHAANYFRLARAAEAIGRDALALEMYQEAGAKARSSETIDGMSLVGAARDHRFRLLLKLATSNRKLKRWDESCGQLATAAQVARSDPERLQAQLLLADVLLDAGRPGDSVDICERLLNDERLRPLAVAAADGHRTIRADLLIADRLSTIVATHGRGVYESYDREAARLFERGRVEKDARLLDLVCRTFPVAEIVPDALLALGAIHESSRRWPDAALAYKRLLLVARDDDRRALALWRLAHVYEARKLFLSARDSYLDLRARYPAVVLAGQGTPARVAERVAAVLTRSPYAQLVADLPVPQTPAPLVRRWHWQAPTSEPIRVLCAVGVAPSLDAGRLFLVEKNGLRMLDPTNGLSRWSAELGGPAVWAGYLSDKLIVATSRLIVAVELGQGTVVWRHDVSRTGKNLDRPDPFADAKDGDGGLRRERPSEALSDFQLVKGRVFCLRGQTELLALDGDTGALDWSFSSPPGQINANLLIGADRTVLQVDKPNQLLVLRTDDGQPIARTALDENERLERVPVPVDEDSVVLVSDRRTVKKFDLSHGQPVWVYQESPDLPVNGPPRLLGDSEHLLVLHDGRLLIRLDPATGSKIWSCQLGVEDLSARPGAMAYDEKRFYCVNKDGSLRQTIRAISLDQGQAVWSRHLTGPQDTGWSLALTQSYVIACPNNTSDNQSGSAPDLVEGDKPPALVMPLVIRRRDNGELVQRFDFPTTSADVTFKADPRGALVATTRGLWGLGSKEASASPVLERGH